MKRLIIIIPVLEYPLFNIKPMAVKVILNVLYLFKIKNRQKKYSNT